KKAKVAVRCPWSDERSGAIRRTETIHVGLGAPGTTLTIPAEQGADASAQPEEPLDHGGRRAESRDHRGPHVVGGTACAAPRQPAPPRGFQRDVRPASVRAKPAP